MFCSKLSSTGTLCCPPQATPFPNPKQGAPRPARALYLLQRATHLDSIPAPASGKQAASTCAAACRHLPLPPPPPVATCTMAKQLRQARAVLRAAKEWLCQDLPEIVAPSSMPNPPGYLAEQQQQAPQRNYAAVGSCTASSTAAGSVLLGRLIRAIHLAISLLHNCHHFCAGHPPPLPTFTPHAAVLARVPALRRDLGQQQDGAAGGAAGGRAAGAHPGRAGGAHSDRRVWCVWERPGGGLGAGQPAPFNRAKQLPSL